MRISCTSDPIDKMDVDTISVSFFSDERPLQGSAGLVDWRLCGRISQLILQEQFCGDYGEKLLVHSGSRLSAQRVLVTGTGPVQHYDYERLSGILRLLVETYHGVQAKAVGFTFPGVGIAGLEYTVALDRLLESFSLWRRDKDWIENLDLRLVAHESRMGELYSHMEAKVKNLHWVEMAGRRFRCVSS